MGRRLLGRLLSVDNVQHTVLKSFLVFAQAVLFPGKVEHLHVELVAGQTVFKHSDALLVAGLLLKLQRAAVLHELLELSWVTATQFF